MFTRLQIKVLSCFVLSTYADYFIFSNMEKKKTLWKQSPLLAPHRKWRLSRLHAVCQMKMGYVKPLTNKTHGTCRSEFLVHASLPCLVKVSSRVKKHNFSKFATFSWLNWAHQELSCKKNSRKKCFFCAELWSAKVFSMLSILIDRWQVLSNLIRVPLCWTKLITQFDRNRSLQV